MKRYVLPLILIVLLCAELVRVIYLRGQEEKAKKKNVTPVKETELVPPPLPALPELLKEEKPKEEKPKEKPVPPKIMEVEKSTPVPSGPPPQGMVYVLYGEFVMGTNEGTEFEKPKRKITLTHYYIDQYEVTNAEYKKFVDATEHKPPKHWIDSNYPSGKANYPVVNVTWYDAEEYAKWVGKRLPSEEEWEKAARGTDGRIYPWGNEWDETKANTRVGFVTRSSQPVGKYPQGKSPCGAYDLAGNVWEWTAGKFDEKYRVIRGGSFLQPPELARSSYRDFFEANKYREDIGFRCVKDVEIK